MMSNIGSDLILILLIMFAIKFEPCFVLCLIHQDALD